VCFLQFKEKDGSIRVRKNGEKSDFRGTTIYASPFVHDGEDQGPRDDICSIIHVFIDLICGKLPWNEAAKAKDKVQVGNIKKKYYEKPEDFISWIITTVENAELNRSLSETNFPLITQEKLLRIIQILKVRTLPFHSFLMFIICFLPSCPFLSFFFRI
jgi:hypothetical protein